MVFQSELPRNKQNIFERIKYFEDYMEYKTLIILWKAEQTNRA